MIKQFSLKLEKLFCQQQIHQNFSTLTKANQKINNNNNKNNFIFNINDHFQLQFVIPSFDKYFNEKLNSQSLSLESKIQQINKVKLIKNEQISIEELLEIGQKYAQLNHQHTEDWENFYQQLQKYFENISKTDFSTIIWILGKSIPSDQQKLLYQNLENKIIKNEYKLDEQNLSLIIWSFARQYQGQLNFWVQTSQKILEISQNLSIIDISNLAWSFQRIQLLFTKSSDLNQLYNQIWDSLESEIIKKDKIEDENTFSTLLYSFAKAKKGSEQLWKKFNHQFAKDIANFTNSNITICLWGVAKQQKSQVQIQIIEKHLMQNLDYFSKTELISICWSFQKLQKGNESFWEKIYSKIKTILTSNQNNIDLDNLSHLVGILSDHNNFIREKIDWEKIGQIIIKNQTSMKYSHLIEFITGFGQNSLQNTEIWQFFDQKIQLYLQNYLKLIQEDQIKEDSLQYIQNFQIFSLQNLILIQQSFAINQAGSRIMFQKIELLFTKNFDNFSLSGLIAMTWGFLKSNHLSKYQIEQNEQKKVLTLNFLFKIKKNCDQIIIGSYDFGMLMWVLGKLNYNHEYIIEILGFYEGQILQKLKESFQNQIYQPGWLSQHDLLNIMTAYNTYNLGREEFWTKLERAVSLYKDFLQDEIFSNILRIGLKRFSWDFQNSSIQIISTNKTKYSSQVLMNIISSFSKLYLRFDHQSLEKVQDIDSKKLKIMNLFQILEAEVETRTQKDKFDLFQLISILNTMAHANIGSINFWRKQEEYILTKQGKELQDSFNSKDVASQNLRIAVQQLLEVVTLIPFGKSSLLDILIPISKIVLKSNNIHLRELNSYIVSFSKAKIGDDELWYLLQMNFQKLYVKMTNKLILRLLACFSELKKGQFSFWQKMQQHLIEIAVLEKSDLIYLRKIIDDYVSQNNLQFFILVYQETLEKFYSSGQIVIWIESLIYLVQSQKFINWMLKNQQSKQNKSIMQQISSALKNEQSNILTEDQKILLSQIIENKVQQQTQ